VARWRVAEVAVTLGRQGALLVEGEGPPRLLPASPVAGGDPCGAGDRFASTAAGRLAAGALTSEAVAAAVAAAASFVAAGGAAGWMDRPAAPVHHGGLAASPDHAMELAAELAATVRRSSGTVVATGGCFDLLHTGHIATLRAARALGDCLIVCLNSDSSVRRLKGPDRPLVPERDRAAVLAALGCVDAVVVFDELTPERVLDRLRPDVFAKGGDYALTDLPEAALLATWGGQAVVLPYVADRSTTRLLEEARRHAPDIPTGANAGGRPPRHA
jgi:rfaE bifunctional protein nucleotidyltransferase chain/domain